MTTIACRKCGLPKSPSEFHKNSAAPGGLRLDCKACRREKAVADYAANPDAGKTRTTEWAKNNPDRRRASCRKHAEANRDKKRASSRAWQKANKARDAERSARQRAEVNRATPAWADKRYIALFYEIAKLEEARTGRKVHVDHIYPLNSDWVCGLHVEHNLQLLFAEENVSKGNRRIELNGGGLSL